MLPINLPPLQLKRHENHPITMLTYVCRLVHEQYIWNAEGDSCSIQLLPSKGNSVPRLMYMVMKFMIVYKKKVLTRILLHK